MAVINQAWYEWAHHAPLAKAGGVSEEGMELLEQPDLDGKNGSEVLSKKLWAVVDYTDAMTRDVAVKDGVFEQLREHFSEQEVVEVTATVAAYNCVSRFLVALDVGEKNAWRSPGVSNSK